MAFLAGKRALIVGVASQRSIAYGIAQAMHREGAELAFTFQNERLEPRVREIASDLDSQICLPCDVESDTEIEAVFSGLGSHWDGMDILVHAVAFAPREALKGDYLDGLDREAFRIAHDISSYSFSALAKTARPMLQHRNGALLTLTYLGAERVLPNYNIMGVAKASLEANVRYLAESLGPEGIRVNALSAGPMKTLAAAGIAGFRRFLEDSANNAPLRRNVSLEDVGNAAAFLCSDLALGITGETLYVDAGFNIIGMPSH